MTVAGLRVKCPDCQTILQLPEGFEQSKVRCSQCHVPFRLPSMSDADILGVLGRRNMADSTVEDGQIVAGEVVEQIDIPNFSGGRRLHATVGPFKTGVEGVVLIEAGRKGARFQIATHALKDVAVRSAMPRRCLRCGSKSHLRPHPIIFSHSLRDSATVETEFAGQQPPLTEQEATTLPIPEILERMGEVARIPAPANLPFVYWICDMCTPNDMVLARNEISSETHQGQVQLQIARLWRAEEFLHELGGKGSDADDVIAEAIEHHIESPWDQLPGVVQQRLRQWYTPRSKEKFVAFVPIHTRLRAESGMAGVIISTQRMIYHHSMRHRDCEKDEAVTLTFARQEGQLRLNVEGNGWSLKNLHIDQAGLESLRRALLSEKFNAVWQ